MSKQPKL